MNTKKEMFIIVDLQYGSTGKGLLAGYLAKRHEVDTVVTAWGPNAGHTFVDAKGNKMINIALPNGIVSPKLRRVLLGPGSVINPELLHYELFEEHSYWMEGVELMIHENAAVVQERHREEEATSGLGIGSTMKGVGAAVCEKIRRATADQITAGRVLMGTPLEGYVVDAFIYQRALDDAEKILIEGAQGYSLSINHGFYPYCTSRDCTTLQILSDCGIPAPSKHFKAHGHIYGVARTYPIRVANRFKDEPCPCGGRFGELHKAACPVCHGSGTIRMQVGWSGPHYPDQEEIEWSKIGLKPELTTVTRLPRRIFTFSHEQINAAVRQNGVDAIFLNFCNYVQDPDHLSSIIERIEHENKVPVRWKGFGPKESDIIEVDE